MNLIEIVFALLLFSCAGTATCAAWFDATSALTEVTNQQIANICADDAAEKLFAGVAVPDVMEMDGRACRVEVDINAPNFEQGTLVQARCGSAVEQIFLPSSS